MITRQVFRIASILILSLVSETVFAQSAEDNLQTFKKSIFFPYPDFLLNNCIPTATVLKIEFDSAGKIKDMQLSDSADLLVRAAFQSNVKFYKKEALEKYASYTNLFNSALLIPLYISFTSDHCSVMMKYPAITSMTKFNTESYSGKTMVVSSIDMKIGKPEQ